METKTAFTIKVLEQIRDVYRAEIAKYDKRIEKWVSLKVEELMKGSERDELSLSEYTIEIEMAMDARAISERKLSAINTLIYEEHALDTKVNIPTEDLLPTLTH